MRPLGIPTFTDKLVQEALRMILEAVYEPIFAESSHGFRPNRSCHTALQSITHSFTGVRWFVEGDIKGFFDHIDHEVLVRLVGQKIKDARITQLLYKMLKAGYMEDWRFNHTISGTPQGGTVRVPYESSAGPAEADDGDESGNDSEKRDGNLTLPDFIYTTYNSLLENGWKMADIDGMDMLGYLKVRVWKAKRDQEKKQSVHRYIDEVWGNMKPNV